MSKRKIPLSGSNGRLSGREGQRGGSAHAPGCILLLILHKQWRLEVEWENYHGFFKIFWQLLGFFNKRDHSIDSPSHSAPITEIPATAHRLA
jgi:hypothetical protein